MMLDQYHTARAEAEAGIRRSDEAIREAQGKHSPLRPYLSRYVAQRAAYAITAARLHARIEREELKG